MSEAYLDPSDRSRRALAVLAQSAASRPRSRPRPVPPSQDEPPFLDDLANSPDPPSNNGSRALVNQSRYEDIARRLLMQQSVKEIARAHDIDPRQVRRILREPGMAAAYERAKEEIYRNLDKVIVDEKAAPLMRARAQMIRAQTLLGEIMNEVRERIQNGSAKATDLKVASDTAFGVIDRSKSELAGNDTAATEVNILNVSAGTAEILRDTLTESGLDLTDVINDVIDITPAADALDTPTNGREAQPDS